MPNANAMRAAEELRDELRYTLAVDSDGDPLTYRAREMTFAEWEAGKHPDPDGLPCAPDEVCEEDPYRFVTRRAVDVEWRCDSKMEFRGVKIRFDNGETLPCYLHVDEAEMSITCSDAHLSFCEDRHGAWLDWARDEFAQHKEAGQ